MNKLTTTGLLLLIIFSSFKVYSQVESTKFKEGVYFTLNDLKANKPSIPMSSVYFEYSKDKEMSFCSKIIEYLDENKQLQSIKSKDVYAICTNGSIYFRFTTSGVLNSESCFHKVYHVGTISLLFVKTNTTVYQTTGVNAFGAPQSSGHKEVNITEYAVIFDSGKWYNTKSGSSYIIEYIKHDNYFKDTKIKKKDLFVYISQYNKRHPIELPN